jgi:hypothetical protein
VVPLDGESQGKYQLVIISTELARLLCVTATCLRLQIAVHSPHEVPDATNRPYESQSGRTYYLAVKNTLTVSSPEVRQLPIHRRRCRYSDETESFGIPVYTYKLCRMKCRNSLAVEMCGCSPPLYQQLGSTGDKNHGFPAWQSPDARYS